MSSKTIGGTIYNVTVWIGNFAYIQLLWLLFLIPGLVVFGIFPATAGMFYVVRKWLIGQSDLPIFHSFWMVYKKEFFKVNMLGLLLTMIGYVLYVDINYFVFNGSFIQSIGKIVAIILIYLFIGTCIYFFPVYVHFKFKLLDYLKYSFLFSLSFPRRTALLIAMTVAVSYAFSKIPGLIIFFFASFICFLWMWGVYTIFLKQKIKNDFAATITNPNR
ncbi:putative membrane protein YesL [Scopulibacillus darangshiensis]|uniref:Putative membrane protein YesL n=1 Tax=Scopulibacillus darangshiensis TaxID=442528 RepID=A0A4R2P5H4_9BACL|nr:DUF624 domain-containing protein [Scopulibacillus darangshiensis]TCP29448.1 putative membrane protein YesL [Scopulibacillus darangshiensis]